MDYNKRLEVLKMPKTKEVLAEMERIHFEQRFDAGAMFDTLSAEEATRAYNGLLAKLPSIPGITDAERDTLQKEIERRIAEVPNVEAALKQMKANEREIAKKEDIEIE